MSEEVYIGGHSLGAADAFLYAHSRLQRGLRVDGIYAFASPRPGDSILHDSVARIPTLVSIQNACDDVTWVPFDAHVAERGWNYVDAVPFTGIVEPAPWSNFLLDPFFCHHHITLYQTGVHKLPANSAAVGINEAVDAVVRLYDDATGWDWINPVDGLYWAMKTMPNGARLMIRRGSKTGRDWLMEDFRFDQRDWYGARASVGFCAGIEPIQNELDAVLV